MLLNPPATSAGVRTRNAVGRAARALGYDRVVLANLCTVPTASVVQLNLLGKDAWKFARADLETSLPSAAAVLAAWGIAGLTGRARQARDEQVFWLSKQVKASSIESLWMVGGKPRHPSRWHQYVSDKYGHTSGGTFEERIKQVLVEVPL